MDKLMILKKVVQEKRAEKKKQLKIAFQIILKKFAKANRQCEYRDLLTEPYAEMLLKEVSIRTPLK